MDEFINNELHQAAIKAKLDFYFTNKIKVHVLKFNKIFLNGLLIKKIEAKEINNCRYIIADIKGEKEIFVSEIYEVEEFKEDPEKGDGNG